MKKIIFLVGVSLASFFAADPVSILFGDVDPLTTQYLSFTNSKSVAEEFVASKNIEGARYSLDNLEQVQQEIGGVLEAYRRDGIPATMGLLDFTAQVRTYSASSSSSYTRTVNGEVVSHHEEKKSVPQTRQIAWVFHNPKTKQYVPLYLRDNYLHEGQRFQFCSSAQMGQRGAGGAHLASPFNLPNGFLPDESFWGKRNPEWSGGVMPMELDAGSKYQRRGVRKIPVTDGDAAVPKKKGKGNRRVRFVLPDGPIPEVD